jgi:hypothetical protein
VILKNPARIKSRQAIVKMAAPGQLLATVNSFFENSISEMKQAV